MTAAEKLEAAVDLMETGIEMMRENLRRRHPKATRAEIDRRLDEWLHTRPGAENGDGVGVRNDARLKR